METSPSALGSGVISRSEAGLLSAISESTTGAADLLLAISGYVGGEVELCGSQMSRFIGSRNGSRYVRVSTGVGVEVQEMARGPRAVSERIQGWWWW